MNPYVASILAIFSAAVTFFAIVLIITDHDKHTTKKEILALVVLVIVTIIIGGLSIKFFYTEADKGFKKRESQALAKINNKFITKTKQANRFISQINKYYEEVGRYGDVTELTVYSNNANFEVPRDINYKIAKIPTGSVVKIFTEEYVELKMNIIIKNGKITDISCSRATDWERMKDLMPRVIKCNTLEKLITN